MGVTGRSLKDQVRSSVFQEESFRVELLLLLVVRNQLRWFSHFHPEVFQA